MESGVPLCSTCGEPVGLSSADKEEVFVACHGCNYPLCSACLEDEIREGRDSCLRCGEPYVRNVTEVNGESGNPLWKNRVDSWMEKKSKKKTSKKAEKAQIPVEQQMEDQEYEKEGEESHLAAVDFFVSTVDPLKEPPLVTGNTVLSILSVDYPVEKVSCYVSDDGSSMLTFESLVETAEFARKWVPFCKKYSIEPRAPEFYFSQKIDYLKDKIQPSFVKERRAMKVFLGHSGAHDIEGNELPRLVYVSREKRPGYQHHKKAGAMNALVNMKGLDGIQGPVYVGTGCVFNRQAMYGYGPPSLPVLPKSSFCSSCCCCCRRSTKAPDDQNDVYRDARREDLDSAIFNLKEIDNYDEYERSQLISQTSFEKTFGQSSVFIESTLMENGGVPESANPSTLIKEAIHVISCGYEEKTQWGKELSNIASVWFLGLFISIILTSVLELRWSGVGIEDWWRNEQFWVIGGVSAHLFAVFQGFLKMLAGIDTNFTVTAKGTDDTEFGELYMFKWTTVLIPPTTILVVNFVGVVAGFSDALNSGYESWGPLFGKVFFALWVILHLYPFLKGLMGRQNRTPTIVVLWSVLLASVFSLLWVKIDPFISNSGNTKSENCASVIC
ncbi:hypothetical protein BHE74_00029411 [Ensete ventricosum]|nr:hypothetical protein GW17_00003792 [Ensete ventricosum]RWW63409.1 hypothetical protein BHE74_00029411 [Ensete ventricosum]